jgi:hypothetical protein
MKIFEVVEIQEALDIKRVGDVWRIIDTSTGDFASEIIFTSAGDAEQARDSMKAKAPATTDPETDPDTKKDKKIKPGVRPGTPTRGMLSKGQLRKLSKTGKINYKGKVYTTKQVMAATAQAKRLAKVKTDIEIDKKDTDTGTQSDSKTKKRFKRVLNWLGSFSKTGVFQLVFMLVTLDQLTKAFSAYMAVLEEPEVDFDQSHPRAKKAYVELRDEVVTAMGATISSAAASVAFMIGVLKNVIALGGPVGYITGVVLGWGAGYAIDWFVGKIVEKSKLAYWLADTLIFENFLSPTALKTYAQGYEKTMTGIGNTVSDSIIESSVASDVKTSAEEVAAELKADPVVRKAAEKLGGKVSKSKAIAMLDAEASKQS